VQKLQTSDAYQQEGGSAVATNCFMIDFIAGTRLTKPAPFDLKITF